MDLSEKELDEMIVKIADELEKRLGEKRVFALTVYDGELEHCAFTTNMDPSFGAELLLDNAKRLKQKAS